MGLLRAVAVVRAILCVCLVILVGCQASPVADDLTQREANEIVAVLGARNIQASVEKQKGARGRYSVSVSQQEFPQAAALLTSLQLPEEKKPSFTDLTAQSGLLPSSREVEFLRLDRALAAELEDLLKGFPEVSSSNVVVRAHGLDQGVTPSVSAVVQVKAGATIPAESVKLLLARTVPGLKADDVVLSVAEQHRVIAATGVHVQSQSPEGSRSMVPFLLFWKVPEGEYAGLAALVVGLLLAVSLIAGLFGYVLGQYFLSRSVEFNQPLDPLDGGVLPGTRYSQLDAPTEADSRGGKELEEDNEETR